MADSSKGSSSKLPLLLVALYFGCRQASRYLLNQHVNACSASQPLLTTRRQAFSPEELRALQAGVQELLPDVKTQPLGKGFKNTRGACQRPHYATHSPLVPADFADLADRIISSAPPHHHDHPLSYFTTRMDRRLGAQVQRRWSTPIVRRG